MTTPMDGPENRAHLSPTGIAPKGPEALDPATAFALLEALPPTIDVAQKAFSAMGRDVETVIVSVMDSHRLKKDEYELKVDVRNLTGHGLYVENITLEPCESREGYTTDPPITIMIADKPSMSMGDPGGQGRSNGYTPTLIPSGKKQAFTITIGLMERTWPTIHQGGEAVIHVTKLGQSGPTETRRQRFPIR